MNYGIGTRARYLRNFLEELEFNDGPLMSTAELLNRKEVDEGFFPYWETIMRSLVGEEIPEKIPCLSNTRMEQLNVSPVPRVGGFMWLMNDRKP